jgi:hypothetical protein
MGMVKMLKIVLLVVAAVAALTTMSGTASAAKLGATVTISLAKPTIFFAGTDALSGTVTNKQAGEKVTVLAQAYGEATFQHGRRLDVHGQPEDPDRLRGAVDDPDQPNGDS